MARKLKPFYRVEGRLLRPPYAPKGPKWSDWVPLTGMVRIPTIEQATKLFKKSKRTHQCPQTRIVKITYEVVAFRGEKGVQS